MLLVRNISKNQSLREDLVLNVELMQMRTQLHGVRNEEIQERHRHLERREALDWCQDVGVSWLKNEASHGSGLCAPPDGVTRRTRFIRELSQISTMRYQFHLNFFNSQSCKDLEVLTQFSSPEAGLILSSQCLAVFVENASGWRLVTAGVMNNLSIQAMTDASSSGAIGSALLEIIDCRLFSSFLEAIDMDRLEIRSCSNGKSEALK